MAIYVERLIPAECGRLWALTQTPELHERWDLRFTSIRHLRTARPEDSQTFEYATRIGFGMTIRGTGVTLGRQDTGEGESSSALWFGSDDCRSLIREGRGYWRYAPGPAGDTRFITSYDYVVRWGKLGRLVDGAVFRPLMAWATAWSFDRLARWATGGVTPETSLRISLAYSMARLTVAAVWFYEGVFPKVLGTRAEEISMTIRTGIPAGWAWGFVMGLGTVEILWSVLVVLLWRRRWPLWISAAAMVPALLAGMHGAPELITATFNVVVINMMLMALSLVALVLLPDVVTATNCRWSWRRGTRGAESHKGGAA